MTDTRNTPPVVLPPADTGSASAAVSRRAEFVRAFVEHAGEVPATERLMVRWPTLMTTTALITAGAVVVGIFWNLIKPLPPGAQRDGSRTVVPPSAVQRWTAVAGWDCAPAPDRSFTAQGRDGGWRTGGTGGWNQDGCHGTFASAPLNGLRGNGAPAAVSWSFTPPAGRNTCAISVHVPKPDTSTTWAATIRYGVVASEGGSAYANITIGTAGRDGTWVEAGSFPVSQSRIGLVLDAAATEGSPDSRVPFGQVKADCGA